MALQDAERVQRVGSSRVRAAAVPLALLVLAGCSTASPAPERTDPRPSATAGPSVPTGAPTEQTATPTASPTGSGPSPSGGQPGSEVTVQDAATLQAALARARPGTTITMAPGQYRSKDVRNGATGAPGRFVASTPGTADRPITLRGTPAAVLDGGGAGGGYGLYLRGADHWRLEGFTVSSAAKGIVLDGSNHVTIASVRVSDIGAEGVHFRAFSSDNTLTGSLIERTGVRKPNFGEGVYVGSAVSNWERYSGGRPDASDRNRILDNRIVATAAENIDVKEGSSGGLVRGNVLDGSDIAGRNSADSWLDVKGNGYRIEENRGVHSPLDGFQVHVATEGWGRENFFSRNTLDVRGAGVGIWLQNTAVTAGNVISCSNVVTAAGAGDYATNHYSPVACVH